MVYVSRVTKLIYVVDSLYYFSTLVVTGTNDGVPCSQEECVQDNHFGLLRWVKFIQIVASMTHKAQIDYFPINPSRVILCLEVTELRLYLHFCLVAPAILSNINSLEIDLLDV